jgi:hypothetical protein
VQKIATDAERCAPEPGTQDLGTLGGRTAYRFRTISGLHVYFAESRVKMSSRYQVVEKSSKHDGQGNLLCELWLRDAAGGYSVLRLGHESFEGIHLGDQIELALHLICSPEEAAIALKTPREVSHA